MKTIRKLNDEDLLALHHMLRREDRTLAEIAEWTRGRLPLVVSPRGEPSSECRSEKEFKRRQKEVSRDAMIMQISRYKKSAIFQKWLKQWENQDVELKRLIALQKQRFELLSNLVKDPSKDGMETLSKSLQARLLTLAAEQSDEDLIEGAAKNGWIKNVIRVIQEQSKMERRSAGEQLKDGLKDVAGKDGKVSIEQVNDRVDALLGLKK